MAAASTIPSDLPGIELVRAGLDDLHAGRDTASAAAVAMASRRLRAAGVAVPAVPSQPPPSHRLYALLEREDGRNAHSRYNAIVRRMVSFARALEHARRS